MKKRSKKNTSQSTSEQEPVAVLEGEVLPKESSGDVDPTEKTSSAPDNEVEAELVEELPEDLGLDEGSEAVEEEVRAEVERSVVPYSPLDAYLSEIRRFSPLSKEEEHAAAVQYRETKSPEAAYKLVSGSLWLVVKIARDYERVAQNVLDLIQEGNIGLMEAVQNFDPYRGVRFPSYAVWWIRAYIIRYIIANWRMVKIGTTQAQRKLFFNLKKESDRLEREGIYPSTKLLAERLNVKEGDVVEMSQRLAGSEMSLDAPLHEDNGSTLSSVIPSGSESAEDQIAKRELQSTLVSALAEFEGGLSEKDRKIFKGRIVSEDKLTLQELSDELALSKERVRQIENKLRDKLKVFVSKKLGSELDDWVEQ